MSDSLRPHGLQPTRLLHPWDFPGKSTGVGHYPLLRVGSYYCSNLPCSYYSPSIVVLLMTQRVINIFSQYFFSHAFTFNALDLFISMTFPLKRIYQFRSVTQSCPILCNPMDCSMPGSPVLHSLPEFAQTKGH